MTLVFSKPGLIVVFLLFYFGLLMLANAPVQPMNFTPPTNVIESSHAALHEEAAIIRECSKNGENWQQIWINSSLQRLNCLIKLPDGKIGNYVLQPCKRGILEITAYVLSPEGSIEDAIDLLMAKGCVQVYP